MHKNSFEMDRLNLDQLQAFSDVVELGSFSSAARRRNLTQPAISLRVKQLEMQLGTKLVERVGRKVRATAAGQVFYSQIRPIDQAVANAVAALADIRTSVRGRVVIGAGATFCIYLLPPVIGILKRKHPKLEIIVRTGSTGDIMTWLDENVIDLAAVSMPPADKMLSITPLQNDELVAIFAADDPFDPPYCTPAMLADKPLIMSPAGGGARRVIDPWFEVHGQKCRPMMELGSIEAIKRVVAGHIGYSIISRIAAEEYGEAIGIRAVPLSPRIYRTLALVMRQDKHLTRGIREVVHAFRKSSGPAPAHLPAAS